LLIKVGNAAYWFWHKYHDELKQKADEESGADNQEMLLKKSSLSNVRS